MGGQNANRLEVRVRGNTHQLLEKYKQMARDAHQTGDRVASEYYLQHADHYFRVLNDNRQRQDQRQDGGRNRRSRGGSPDDIGDEDMIAENLGDAGDGSEETSVSEGRARRSPQRRERSQSEGRTRRSQSSRSVADSDDDQTELSDGEAALAAFGGVPSDSGATQEPLILELNEPDDEEIEAKEAPKPRRRGRPRKTEAKVEAEEKAEVVESDS